MPKKPRVLVAMSGGVDSSAAAALLVEQGYDVIGVTMQVWDYSQCNIEEGLGTCCSSSDVDDARSVADLLAPDQWRRDHSAGTGDGRERRGTGDPD